MASQKEYEMLYKLNAQLGSSFSGAFRSAVSTFTELQGKMVEVNETQSDIAAYQKQQQAVENTRAKLELLQKQYDNIQREYQETGEQSSTLANRMLQKQAAIDKTSTALQNETNRLNTLEAELEEAGVDTKNLESESNRLAAEMDELQAATIEAADGAEEFGESGTTAISDVGAMLAAAGIEKALKGIYDAYMDCVGAAGDFEQSMSNVEALSGASSEELQQLSETAKEMGATTSFTAKQSADAFSYMALAGWDTEAMLQGIHPVLSLAAAANMDLAQASDIVTDYLTAFGLSADQTAGFVDQMAYAMSHSNTNVAQLGEAYKGVAATARSLGQEVSTTTAIVMALSDAGIKGSEAGTAANSVFTRLATNTKNCATALKEYADVEVYQDGQMRNMIAILDDTAVAWNTMTGEEQSALAKAVAGTSHYSAFATMMDSASKSVENGASKISAYATALEDCAGTAGEMADTMLDNLNGQLTLMQSAFDGLTIAVGEQFQPQMSKLYETAAEVLGQTTEFVETNPALVRAIASVVAGLGSALAAITAIAAAKKAMAAIDLAAMFTSPVGAAIALTGVLVGVAGAVASINEEYDTYTATSDALNESIETLKNSTSDIMTRHNEAVDANEAEAASTLGLINKLNSLVTAYDGTEASAVEVNAVIDELNASVPGLDLSFDSLSGSINKTADEIVTLVHAAEASNAVIEAMQHEQEMYGNFSSLADEAARALSAYQRQLVAVNAAALDDSVGLDDFGRMQTELDNLAAAYADAVSARDAAESGWKDAKSELDDAKDAYNQLTGSVEEYTSANESNAAADSKSSKTMLQLKYATEAVKNGYLDATAAAKMYGLSEEELGDYMDAEDTKAKAVEDAVSAVSHGYLSAEKAAEAFGLSLNEVNDGLKAEYLDNVSSAAYGLAEAYGAAYTAAYDSFSGQFELWEKVDKTSATSLSDLQTALDSQITYWQNYNSNLETIANSGIDVSGIWDHITDGSEDAASAAQGLADAISSGNTSAVEDYVADYVALQEEIGNTSDLVATNSQEVQDAISAYQEAISNGVDGFDLTDEANTAASNTIQGYIDGLGDGSEVSNLLTEHATSWLEYFNAALGVHSPSTITNESGVNTIQGFVGGVDATSPEGESAMTNAANAAIIAFEMAMSYSTFYGFGSNAIQGAIDGINAMKSYLVEAARAAGTEAANAYKEAQDINSPSKLFYWFSEMDIQGAIDGWRDNQDALNAAVSTAAQEGADAYNLSASVFRDSPSEAVSAMNAVDGGVTYIITMSPVYNLSGASSPNQVREILEEHTGLMREELEDMLEEIGVDVDRKRWT